jgi:DNA topoisomerase I
MKLVVVESPAKAKTIGRYLGEGFSVSATMGHVKDLPKSKLAVDVENDYEATYHVIKGKKKIITDLKKKLPKNHKDVYLALDPDREGEAIAAHVAEELKLKNPSRVVFHEVTADAVREAIEHPRSINEDLVDAQKARRVLDRLVGYKLSELLWKKIWYGLSAGRVQSVATRLIVEREREREAFVPKEFWEIFAHLLTEAKEPVVAKLAKRDGKKYVPKDKKEVDGLLSKLEAASWKVVGIEAKDKKKYPSPPYTTSTLQQSANNALGYTAKSTMRLAQQLYQGVNIKGKGHVGLITYMRTDSTNLSSQAVKNIRWEIESKFGKKYLPGKAIFYKTKSRLAQEAHEAIRPTDITLTPDLVQDSLNPQQHKLYRLIWNRTMACQMTPMVYNEKVVDIDAACKGNETYNFMMKARKIVFDGFAKLVGTGMIREEGVQEVEAINPDEDLTLKKIETTQKFTKPRPRYSEATLVKALEKYGIGRPSTYANIISTIQSRGYVDKDGRYLFPTDVGFVVNDFLVDHFETIVDYDFTSEIEEQLDEVAQGDRKWVPIVKEVYEPLEKNIEKKDAEVKKEDVVILGDSDVKCPECKGKMVKRLGRDGAFLSCAAFPKCKGMLSIEGKTLEETVDFKKYVEQKKCSECGGKMILKKGKYGTFWACENYPDCKNTVPMLLHEKCPECGEHLVERKGKWGKMFIGCSGYPKCRYIKKEPKKERSDGEEKGSK